MFRRILVVAGIVVTIAAGTGPALANKRIALVVGNSAYQHVGRLDNPKSDATLMAATLRGLGFILIGDGPQLDLDKAGLDRVVQKFGSQLARRRCRHCSTMPATACRCAASNYPGPGRRQSDPRGRRRLPDGRCQSGAAPDGRRRHASSTSSSSMPAATIPSAGADCARPASGLAQMRAPEGTLISFATQPGNVALDGRRQQPLHQGAGGRPFARPGWISSRPSTRSALP